MTNYKLHKSVFGETVSVEKIGANMVVPFDHANTDYQAYLKWLEEGNTPEPADEDPSP
jgi:hypothetical protein